MERTGKAWPTQSDAQWEHARLVDVDRRRYFMLETKIFHRLRCVLGAPDVIVRGFDPQGRDCVIPGRVVSQLQFDLLKGTLSTPDYGVAWHTVTVEMVPEARDLLAKTVEGCPTPDDSEPKTAAHLENWYIARFAGWPTDVPAPSREEDLEAARAAGYELPDLAGKIRALRKARAQKWTRSGPTGRKRAGR
jgi:hypothetical protein